jgi:hypothetical protein
MNEHLKERIVRKLDVLNDERGYQVLDYVEFLESKFAERQTPTGNAFTRFTDAVEDRLRAGKVSAAAIAETMGLLNRAANVLNGAVAAGRSVANDIAAAAQSATTSRSSGGTTGTTGATATATGPAPASPPSPPAQPKEASSPARDIPAPGSGEERL